MKPILITIFLMSFCSCTKANKVVNQLLSQSSDSDTEVLENSTDSLSVYFNKTEEFTNVPDLNKGSKTLNFLDKIVFVNPDLFLQKKKSLKAIKLLGEQEFKKSKKDSEKKIPITVSSFCSKTLEQLQKEGQKSRYSQNFVSTSKPSYINIVSLISKDILSQAMEQNIYCTFVVKFKDKTYVFIQQEINTKAPTEKPHKISLFQLDQNFATIQKGDILRKENLENLIINYGNEESVTQYELFCDGKLLLSIPIVSDTEKYAFKGLFENPHDDLRSKGTQNCVFYVVNENNLKSISPFFQIDFSSFPPIKPAADLSEIGSPSIPARQHLLSSLVFKKMKEIEFSKSYSHIDVLVDTKCVDTNYSSEYVLTKQTRLPLRSEMSIMAFSPEKIIFIISNNEQIRIFNEEIITDNYETELKKLEDNLGNHVEIPSWISNLKDEDSKEEAMYLLLKIAMDKLKNERNKKQKRNDNKYSYSFNCIYKITLEDTRANFDNKKTFKEISHQVKYHDKKFAGYKIDYFKDETNQKGKKLVFLNYKDIKEWVNEALKSRDINESNIKNKIYEEHLLMLSSIKSRDYYLGVFKIISLIDSSYDKMSFKCHVEQFEDVEGYERLKDFKYVAVNWSLNSNSSNDNSIHLKSILIDNTLKRQLKQEKQDETKDYLAICRLFLYSNYTEGLFLKYFSPEIKFIY